MTLNEALSDAMRSKIFILKSVAKDLNLKLDYIKNLYGNVPMGRLCK